MAQNMSPEVLMYIWKYKVEEEYYFKSMGKNNYLKDFGGNLLTIWEKIPISHHL